MKTTLYSIALASISISIAAQNSIPNGNFENWTSGTFDIPQNYVQSSNTQAFYAGLPFNVIKSTDSYHGSYAVQLTTEISNGGTVFGYFINAYPIGNPPWPGGIPYTQKPTGIRGYYKSSIVSPDTARILVAFKLAGKDIGTYIFPLYGTNSSYTLFSFTFNPPLPSNPDTVIFGVASSDFTNNSINRNGSMLKIDSVSFTGVSSQPALFNGDFENWTTQTIEKLDNWYINEWLAQGVNKTTDKVAGNYAVELKTYQGQNQSGNPIAQAGQISTGYWDNSCACPKGGYPFNKQVDTLAFWYKYVPSGNDTALVYLTFKKNSNIIFGTGDFLLPSASYIYKEIPFNIGQIPDTVIILFQSSKWNDTLLSHVGSVLKVDEVHFKSQPLTTSVPIFSMGNNIFIYPNPFSTQTTLRTDNFFTNATLTVYNFFGQKVKEIKNINGKTVTLFRDNLPRGLYFIRLTENNQLIKADKLIITD